jgi:hypothetical protein
VQTTGAFFGFLTSSYTPPSESTDVVPYVPDTNRTWANNGTYELVIPAQTAYLCICPVDGNQKYSKWLVEKWYGPKVEEEPTTKVFRRVELADYTPASYSLGDTKWIGSSLVTKHIVIPVLPNQTIKLRATNSDDAGNFYGFLKSYEVPAYNDTVPYCIARTRVWQRDDAGQVELVCPFDAAFLCLVTSNGSGNKTTWELFKGEEVPQTEALRQNVVGRSDIIDNLVFGGADVPLSAEQGKHLASFSIDEVPVGLTKYEYDGPLVKVNTKHHVSTQEVSEVTAQAFQGGACFGDFLFMFTENNTTCWVYNLAAKALLQAITIPAEERGFVSNCHCNTVNFGVERYDAGDTFPLLYVSTGYGADGYTGALVYRVVETTENDVTTYSLSLVQTLKMPGTGWTEFVVGEDNDCYLCYTQERKIYRMAMPLLAAGDMTFNLDESLSVFQFTQQPAWYNGSRNQNRLYHNGKIYFVSGVPSSEALLFIVLDLATQRREVEIDLANTLGLTSEPETCFIWNGHLCIVFRNRSIVQALYFD